MIRSLKAFSSIAKFTLLMFAASEAVLRPLAFGAGEPVSGVIQAIKDLGGGRYELTVQGAEGDVFVVDASSQIEGTIPAKEVKEGQRIFIPGAGGPGIQGVKGMKNPFGNMSDAMKKQLGLPNMPNIPDVPDVPNVPQIPKLPNIPNLPQNSGIPAGLPGGGAGPMGAPGAGGGAPAAGGGAPGGADLGAAMKDSHKAVEHEAEDLPPPEEMMGPKAPVLSPAGGAPAAELAQPKRVLQAKKTENGVELNLEGEEESVVLPEDAPVKQILAAADLRESMPVKFTVREESGEKIVDQLIVA